MPTFTKLTLIAAALGVGFFANDIIQWFQIATSKPSLDQYCLVTTNGCQTDGAKIRVDRDTSQPLVPTQMTVTWPAAQSESLLLTLQGHEMEMGTLVFKLEQNAYGDYLGEIVLPVCTSDAMTWYGEVSDGSQSLKTSIRMER
ncbi:hypothetical protein [Vibrio sinaloensis]|uniref:hypothetical protein n=1 Tax=Photobacterium sp. (strain ATCC 43367) TaxID=379097 RepID=UPI00206DF0DC|nr:hypothetical protein [Vibrio sinaloensis]UPQ90234.1 hypothetical protein MTO69_15885 [Vibrio sinaloensis]